MKPIKIKLTYPEDWQIFDLTLSVYHWPPQQGQMYVLVPGETEHTLLLSPGDYRLELVYDRPQAEGRQTCLIQRDFNSTTTRRLNLALQKPQQYYSLFSEEELREIGGILQHTIAGNIHLDPTQIVANQLIKQLSPISALAEGVVVDKNGKVEYSWRYQPSDGDADQDADTDTSVDIDSVDIDTDTRADIVNLNISEQNKRFVEDPRRLHPVINKLHLQPANHSVLNAGTWDAALYGTNINVSAIQNGYRNVQALAYLRPRAELLKRLYYFIQESRQIAYVLNGLELT
jgi:hypothetical protein